VRREAVQALLGTFGRSAYERLAQSLPSDQRYLLDLTPVGSDSVAPVADPTRDLAKRAAQDSKPPPSPARIKQNQSEPPSD
jgi:hypothetical protein